MKLSPAKAGFFFAMGELGMLPASFLSVAQLENLESMAFQSLA